MSKLTRRSRWTILCSLALLAAVFGVTAGYFVRVDMPDLRQLEEYAPSQMTRILARDGSEIAAFAAEKRILLDYGEIPKSFHDALIASEDSRFYGHAGIDPVGGARVLWRGVRDGHISQGASTLTMQLVGNLFLDRSQRTWRRKAQEAFLALEIEHRLSKQEIISAYSNQVHFGHGLYGLEAASRYYFGKSAREMTTGESATLVGLLPRPAAYSPFRNMKEAVRRRNLVLRRMVAEGYLPAVRARRIAAEPIEVSNRHGARDVAAYFAEGVRRQLQETYGSADLYRGGMVVRTTLDRRLQEIANAAVERGSRQFDKRQGFRKAALRRVPRDEDPKNWNSPAWQQRIVEGAVTDGVVLRVDAERADIRVAEDLGVLDRKAIGWTGESRPDRLLAKGDVIRVRVLGRDDAGLRLALEQEPEVEAAMIAIDPASGEILALVGGFDFARSEYDRATQAHRQTGSLFKPFVYAAALADGWTLADTLIDEPTVFLDPRKPVPYQPENFSRRYYGPITLRTALAKSANIATVKLLEQVGPDRVIEMSRRLGVQSTLRPYASLALGSFELTLLEVTSAYGAFANRGLLMQPHGIVEIVDRNKKTIHRARPRVSEAVSPQVAYLMNRALAGVIENGTARVAGAALSHTLAGKTGTTDDYTDAWFVGYSPGLVVGVWVGHDEPRSLGDRETGGRAALPIWIDFMRQALEGLPDGPFPRPPGITTVPVDTHTGKRPHAWANCSDRRVEVFVAGTEPTEFCSRSAHRKRMLPLPFQRYGLDDNGSLRIPGNELAQLVAREPEVGYEPRREMLVASGAEGFVEFPVTVLPDSEPPSAPKIAGALDVESWTGTDGRPARLIWLGGGRSKAAAN